MGYSPYSAEDDAVIRAGYAAGDKTAVIAHRIGRTKDAVQMRAVKLGLRHPRVRNGRPLTEVQESEFRGLYESGASVTEIAAHFGLSRGWVWHHSARLGYLPRALEKRAEFDPPPAPEPPKVRRRLVTRDQIAWALQNFPHPEAVAIARLVAAEAA